MSTFKILVCGLVMTTAAWSSSNAQGAICCVAPVYVVPYAPQYGYAMPYRYYRTPVRSAVGWLFGVPHPRLLAAGMMGLNVAAAATGSPRVAAAAAAAGAAPARPAAPGADVPPGDASVDKKQSAADEAPKATVAAVDLSSIERLLQVRVVVPTPDGGETTQVVSVAASASQMSYDLRRISERLDAMDERIGKINVPKEAAQPTNQDIMDKLTLMTGEIAKANTAAEDSKKGIELLKKALVKKGTLTQAEADAK